MVNLTNSEDKIQSKVADMMKEITEMRVKYDDIMKSISEMNVGNIRDIQQQTSEFDKIMNKLGRNGSTCSGQLRC